MSDPYPDLEPWEAYETACQRIAYLESQLGEARDLLEQATAFTNGKTDVDWVRQRDALLNEESE